MTITYANQGQVAESQLIKSALATQTKAALFVNRSSQQWVVLDPEGNLWILPSVANPWDQREPYSSTEESELEPVPGHYKSMLGLPFH